MLVAEGNDLLDQDNLTIALEWIQNPDAALAEVEADELALA